MCGPREALDGDPAAPRRQRQRRPARLSRSSSPAQAGRRSRRPDLPPRRPARRRRGLTRPRCAAALPPLRHRLLPLRTPRALSTIAERYTVRGCPRSRPGHRHRRRPVQARDHARRPGPIGDQVLTEGQSYRRPRRPAPSGARLHRRRHRSAARPPPASATPCASSGRAGLPGAGLAQPDRAAHERTSGAAEPARLAPPRAPLAIVDETTRRAAVDERTVDRRIAATLRRPPARRS